MSWRAAVEWQLRSRVSPEVLAGALVVVLALVILGIVALAQPDRTKPTHRVPTAEPTGSGMASPIAVIETGQTPGYLEGEVGAMGADALVHGWTTPRRKGL